MAKVCPHDFSTFGMSYSQESFEAHNLTLESGWLKDLLQPIAHAICRTMEAAYKSATSLHFQTLFPSNKVNLGQSLRASDICLHLFSQELGENIYLIFESRLARSYITRLLPNSLLDDNSSIVFSPTEKGIFSYISAKLIYELKKTLYGKLPALTIQNIYNSSDEGLENISLINYANHNFTLFFLNDEFPISLLFPLSLLKPFEKRPLESSLFFARLGHINRPFRASVVTFSMSFDAVANLAFGDVILFDNKKLSIKEKTFHGEIFAAWHDFSFQAELTSQSDQQVLLVNSQARAANDEGASMPQVDVSSNLSLIHSDNSELSKKIVDLAENIKVSLSIEVSRIPMSLKEVCNLRTGQLIDLHRKINDPLEIVVENKVIGYCQPVQIDGRLGIRILSLENSPNPE
jgi:flagellar motor switch/type III secretory pathway protein FliN